MSPEQAAGQTSTGSGPAPTFTAWAPRSIACSPAGTPFAGTRSGRDPAPGRTAARSRRPRRIDPTIDRALEAICLKAMALRPEDRYPTPRALADDVERWIADEPVTAWRDPIVERVRRWGAEPHGCHRRRGRGPRGNRRPDCGARRPGRRQPVPEGEECPADRGQRESGGSIRTGAGGDQDFPHRGQ